MSGSIGFREPSYLSNKRFYAITLCVELCGISVGLKHGECYEKKTKKPDLETFTEFGISTLNSNQS